MSTNRKKMFLICLLFVFLIMSFSGNVYGGQVNLQSYSSGFDSIPIAVLPFQPGNGNALTQNRPWEVIADDLAFSGRFNVVRMKKIDRDGFAKHQIGIYIDGHYTLTDDKITLDCYLHDAATKDLLVGKQYRGDLKTLRSMAHRYANHIYEVLLGEQGFFETRIVYVGDKGSTKNLYLMDYDGHNSRQMTSSGIVNIFPAFVDSNTIIWTSFLRGKPDIYKGSTSSGASHIFVYSRFVDTSPAYSPVVDKVAYASSRSGNMDVYTCDLSGANQRQLTFNKSVDTSPCWSPNGYQIAFTSDRSGQPQIYVMDADGANSRRVTFEGSYQDSPAWSPKGDKIAYSSLQNNKFDIWIVNVDGKGAARVTSMPGNNEYPAWSPDGSHIAFASTRGGKCDIYSVRPDGTGLRQITRSGNAKMPDWSKL